VSVRVKIKVRVSSSILPCCRSAGPQSAFNPWPAFSEIRTNRTLDYPAAALEVKFEGWHRYGILSLAAVVTTLAYRHFSAQK